jgi:16S rRNA (cytosine1402-N4)-methyltransferase
MALRIAVNDELQSLDRFFDKIFDYLKPGGRVVVIAFHSGEDRIVKNRLREAVQAGRIRLPVAKPVTPAPAEVEANPRSRSARMRVAEALPPAG